MPTADVPNDLRKRLLDSIDTDLAICDVVKVRWYRDDAAGNSAYPHGLAFLNKEDAAFAVAASLRWERDLRSIRQEVVSHIGEWCPCAGCAGRGPIARCRYCQILSPCPTILRFAKVRGIE